MDNQIQSRIQQFEAAHKNIAIAYGGDGTVLDVVRATKGKKGIIPIRNYGCCDIHKNALDEVLDGADKPPLKLTLCPFIEYSFCDHTNKGIAEIVVKNEDPTSALRFNFFVNDKCYMKNVIADGIVFSTAYGSTGYFKSITRCIFNSPGIGVAFIAPTQGINNLILKNTDRMDIEFIRGSKVFITADKFRDTIYPTKGDKISISTSCDNVSIFGLDEFHCQECRLLRHSIIENGIPQQDQYCL